MKYWIQQFWIKRNLKKLAPGSNRINSPLKQVKRVAVITKEITPEVQVELMEQLETTLGAATEFVCIHFLNKKSTAEVNMYQINTSDFSTTGQFQHKVLRTAVKTPFDLVIHYHQSNNPFVIWLGYQFKAPLQVGFKQVKHNHANLIIDVPFANVIQFVAELNKYINILKTK